MEDLDKEIGLKLKKLREQLGLSMREVGERVGIDHSYVGKIEKGKIPSLDKLKKLCNLYGISVSSLFGDEVEVQQELRDIGVEWITFASEMKKKKLTPDEIKNVIEFLKTIKKL
jgi:transcriptional regulator with XRE-family HTH domain